MFTPLALSCDRDVEDQDLDCVVPDDRLPGRGMHQPFHQGGIQQCPDLVLAGACYFGADDRPHGYDRIIGGG